jgi:diguanylate cyclase (GGDEF)-like protein
MRILLVEDDEALGNILQRSLTQQHYAVDFVNDGQSGWEYAQSAEYDLILLDIGLPRLDGITLCEQLRAQGCATPILLMTAQDAPSERIKGLDSGADDYLIKPLEVDELQARVRALLRRKDGSPAPILEIAGLQLDPSQGQVTYCEQLLKLTPKEYQLLELFLRNPTRLFSRGQIVEHLWTFDDIPSEESVKAHIKGLRQKLKQVEDTNWIENIYGMGYRLSPPIAEPPLPTTEKSIEPPNPDPESETTARSPVESEFNQAVAGLWQQYQAVMCQRMDLLQQAAIASQSSRPMLPKLRQAAAQAAHKLAGVLGMFDKDEGTGFARTIEQCLSAETSDLQSLPTLVHQLEAVLNLSGSSESDSSESDSSESGSSESGSSESGSSESGSSDRTIREVAFVPPSSQHSSSTSSAPTQTHATQILLIEIDSQLTSALQQWSPIAELQWYSFPHLQQAQSWLKTHSPNLLILRFEDKAQWDRYLSVITELSDRTPPVPTIALTSTTELSDRVAIAQSGGQCILPESANAAQIWEAITPILRRSQTVNILAVDDDPIFLDALSLLLEPWGLRVMGLSQPETFWMVLETYPPDLLILDVEMPQFNGIELCQAVRADARWQDLPILFVTARHDRKTIQQIFAAGADDYITKPIVGSELISRITHRLDRIRWLQTLYRKDPLTGLVNQPQAQPLLESLLEQASRSQSVLSFVRIAISDLDSIHLQYGHLLGNQVVHQWGQVLRSQLRGVEMLSHWGNGEFVMVLPGLKTTETEVYLGELLRQLRQQVFMTEEGDRFQVEIWYGIAEYPKDGETVKTLYQVSRAHGNRRIS